MTPTDCLKAGPAELAPIIEQMMPGLETYHLHDGRIFFSKRNAEGLVGYCDPFEQLNHAFRLQDRVAELGLQERFVRHLVAHDIFAGFDHPHDVGLAYEMADDRFAHRAEPGDLFRIATASPLNRTRAACAAYLESKEPARD